MSEFNFEVAMEQYQKRVTENKDLEHINNASLYAGSSMYYYCRKCRVQTQTLPESHICKPTTICNPCKILDDHGLI